MSACAPNFAIPPGAGFGQTESHNYLPPAQTGMVKKPDTGRDPKARALREAERIAALHPEQQKTHPSAIPADPARLAHINTYGALPEYYIDRPFTCRRCGKREIWKGRDQKWYYEEAGGHIDAHAVECRDCRKSKRAGGPAP